MTERLVFGYRGEGPREGRTPSPRSQRYFGIAQLCAPAAGM
jgi:hypothetical protein